MQVVHSAGTRPSDLAAEAQQQSPLQEGNFLGGACLNHGGDDMVVREYWEPFTVHNVEAVVGRHEPDEIVLGSYAEEIAERLRDRYDIDTPPGGSRVVQVDAFELCRTARSDRYYHRRKSHRHTGWVILDRPLMRDIPLGALVDICLQFGPVLVNAGTGDLPQTDDAWARAGFTIRERAHELGLQVNYNPKAIARRPWTREKREAQRRLRGDWPADVLHNLAAKLHPQNYPSDHPFCVIVVGPPLTETRGWGNKRDLAFSPTEIMQLRDLTLKLWPGQHWWRTKDDSKTYWQENFSFKGWLAKALLYVHSAEQKVAEDTATCVSRAKHEYACRVAENAVVKDAEELPTEEEYVRDRLAAMQHRHWPVVGRFCKWLRAEARACQVPMPKKPVIPLSPAQKEKLARKRRKQRQRRKSCNQKE